MSLAGTGLVDYRGARCRFGGYHESWAAVTSGDVASCGKPIFPDEARYLKGEIVLEFSANGQCYGGGAAASFVVYNALVTKLEPGGVRTWSPCPRSNHVDPNHNPCRSTRSPSAAASRGPPTPTPPST